MQEGVNTKFHQLDVEQVPNRAIYRIGSSVSLPFAIELQLDEAWDWQEVVSQFFRSNLLLHSSSHASKHTLPKSKPFSLQSWSQLEICSMANQAQSNWNAQPIERSSPFFCFH